MPWLKGPAHCNWRRSFCTSCIAGRPLALSVLPPGASSSVDVCLRLPSCAFHRRGGAQLATDRCCQCCSDTIPSPEQPCMASLSTHNARSCPRFTSQLDCCCASWGCYACSPEHCMQILNVANEVLCINVRMTVWSLCWASPQLSNIGESECLRLLFALILPYSCLHGCS